jgi:hypothetical protein
MHDLNISVQEFLTLMKIIHDSRSRNTRVAQNLYTVILSTKIWHEHASLCPETVHAT